MNKKSMYILKLAPSKIAKIFSKLSEDNMQELNRMLGENKDMLCENLNEYFNGIRVGDNLIKKIYSAYNLARLNLLARIVSLIS